MKLMLIIEFEEEVRAWMHACFGKEILNDITERNYRFLEESLELVQSLGCTKEDALKLVDYTFSRPKGNPHQEIGGVMVTLAALCSAYGEDLELCSEDELASVWRKIDQIRQKHQNKPVKSPLPGKTTTNE